MTDKTATADSSEPTTEQKHAEEVAGLKAEIKSVERTGRGFLAVGAGAYLAKYSMAAITPEADSLTQFFASAGASAAGSLLVTGMALTFYHDPKNSLIMKAAAAGFVIGTVGAFDKITDIDAEASRMKALPKISIHDLGATFKGNALADVCAQALKTNKPIVWDGKEFALDCAQPAAAGPR